MRGGWVYIMTYVADEPSNSQIPRLRRLDQYIRAHAPTKLSFFVAENNATDQDPSYAVTPANTKADLVGLDPYPVRPDGMDLGIINAAVTAALDVGWALDQLVPVYQAFGNGSGDYANWALPTASQEDQILSTWATLTPTPAFDYAYSWGIQGGDSALVNTSALQAVFAQQNS
jgi:hypothetical protein